MEWYIIASFVVLAALLIIGIPVPYVFFGTMLFLVIFGGYSPSFLLPYAYSQVASMTCITLPLFIIAGGIIERGGIGEQLINFVNLFLGRIKGGLGIVMVVCCAVFGAISGSSYAAETVMGAILLPRMREAHYDDATCAALLASASMLGSYIPPSGMMLIFAWLTNQSVLACFLCTIVPGIILMFAFSIWIWFKCRKNPDIVLPEVLHGAERRIHFGKTCWKAIPALIFPIIVLGGIYGGIMTPTEAAAVSILYAIPVAIYVYRKLSWKDILPIFQSTGTSAGIVVVMIFTVSLISRIYLIENLPEMVLGLIYQLTDNRYVILMIINIFLVFLGLIMDDTSAMMLSSPILLPIVVQLGVDPVQYAAIVAVNLGLGCVSPPLRAAAVHGRPRRQHDADKNVQAEFLHYAVHLAADDPSGHLYPGAFPVAAESRAWIRGVNRCAQNQKKRRTASSALRKLYSKRGEGCFLMRERRSPLLFR